jgi:hypothetical protein
MFFYYVSAIIINADSEKLGNGTIRIIQEIPIAVNLNFSISIAFKLSVAHHKLGVTTYYWRTTEWI